LNFGKPRKHKLLNANNLKRPYPKPQLNNCDNQIDINNSQMMGNKLQYWIEPNCVKLFYKKNHNYFKFWYGFWLDVGLMNKKVEKWTNLKLTWLIRFIASIWLQLFFTSIDILFQQVFAARHPIRNSINNYALIIYL